jgi:SecD/SecF fusion protein
MTKRAFEKGRAPIAIVLDDIVYSGPSVNGEITGGNSNHHHGRWKGQTIKWMKERKTLATCLKSGKLEAPAKIVQEAS